ncbi:papain-like cysteine protease family protein [Pseudomonas antarctica]|uniref:papain-like cysteine protease family protein n=1 Tax=Pseudomonas antarctica TaxID=219572 RepID=UPI00387B363F
MKIGYWLAGVMVFSQCFNATADFVGLQKAEFESHYAVQQTPLWCWAASTQMILSYQGVKVPQDKIVTRVTGTLGAGAGSVPDMIKAANGLFSVDGKQIVVSGQYVNGAPLATVLFNQLSHKRPVILNYLAPAGGVGHAVVVTAIDASVVSGEVMISSVYVFDPFPYHMVPNPWGGFNYVYDENLKTKTYNLSSSGGYVYINPGVITGVILIDGIAL